MYTHIACQTYLKRFHILEAYQLIVISFHISLDSRICIYDFNMYCCQTGVYYQNQEHLQLIHYHIQQSRSWTMLYRRVTRNIHLSKRCALKYCYWHEYRLQLFIFRDHSRVILIQNQCDNIYRTDANVYTGIYKMHIPVEMHLSSDLRCNI